MFAPLLAADNKLVFDCRPQSASQREGFQNNQVEKVTFDLPESDAVMEDIAAIDRNKLAKQLEDREIGKRFLFAGNSTKRRAYLDRSLSCRQTNKHR